MKKKHIHTPSPHAQVYSVVRKIIQLFLTIVFRPLRRRRRRRSQAGRNGGKVVKYLIVSLYAIFFYIKYNNNNSYTVQHENRFYVIPKSSIRCDEEILHISFLMYFVIASLERRRANIYPAARSEAIEG